MNLDTTLTIAVAAASVAVTAGGLLWRQRSTEREVERLRERMHDVENLAGRHDIWVTVIRERLGLKDHPPGGGE